MPYADPAKKNAQAAEYRAANRERLRQRSRDYRAANPELIAAANASWYAGHSESERAAARRRYSENPEARRRTARAWTERNPRRTAALAAATNANQRAARGGNAGRLTADDIEALWDREPKCADCHIEVQGVDHIIGLADGGPNTPGNLANRCLSCNVRKGNRDRTCRMVAV